MAYETMQRMVDLGNFEDQDDSLLTLNDWIKLYEAKTGRKMNAGTMRKRRSVSGLGQLVPPRVYILSRDEFEQVLKTPLPMCNNVVKNV